MVSCARAALVVLVALVSEAVRVNPLSSLAGSPSNWPSKEVGSLLTARNNAHGVVNIVKFIKQIEQERQVIREENEEDFNMANSLRVFLEDLDDDLDRRLREQGIRCLFEGKSNNVVHMEAYPNDPTLTRGKGVFRTNARLMEKDVNLNELQSAMAAIDMEGLLNEGILLLEPSNTPEKTKVSVIAKEQ